MNKTLQRVLSLVLCVLMALSGATVAFAADSEEAVSSLGAQYFLSTTNAENAKFVLDAADKELAKQNLNAKIDENLDKEISLGSQNSILKINPKTTLNRIGLVIPSKQRFLTLRITPFSISRSAPPQKPFSAMFTTSRSKRGKPE